MAKRNPSLARQEADNIIKNTYRTLMTRGMKGCYVYCCDPALAEHFRELMAEKQEVAEVVRIEPTVNDDVKYIDFLSVYSIKAACGYFGEGEQVSELGWIQVERLGKLNRNMYVVQAAGHSMEPQKPYNGKLNLRMPSELHSRVAAFVATSGTTINDFINRAICNELNKVAVI